MIQANELRIGNILYGYDPMSMGVGSKGYFDVVNIEVDGNRINTWRVEGFDDVSAQGQPIPLSPDILEKLGFIRHNCGISGAAM